MVPLRGNLCPCAYVISPLVVVVIYLLSYWNIFSHADFYLKAKFDYARSRATHHAVFMEALERRACTQEERLDHLRSVCEQLARGMPKEFLKPARRIMSDEIHRILYCHMSKVGCTTFKTLIATANANRLNATHRLPPPSEHVKIHFVGVTKMFNFSSFSTTGLTDDQIRYRLGNYFTFMVTRHPMERLLSAWRDKILYARDATSLRGLRFRVLQHVRPRLFSAAPNGSHADRKHYWRQLGKHHVPSFPEFIQWIVETRVDNEHWRSAVHSCHPCAHAWSAILRLETMATDKGILLERLGRDLPEEDVGKIHTTANHSSFFPSLQLKEWERVDPNYEDYILQLYRQDMELLGYQWDRGSKTTACTVRTPHGVCC